MVRRVAVALVCASASALLASRVNRPVPLDVLHEFRAADEVLPQVQLDMRSLRSAVASIQRVAKCKIVIESPTLPPDDDRHDEPAKWPVLPLRNVRVGTALSIVMEYFRDEPFVSYTERSGEIVIDDPPKRPVFMRMYDISDLVARGREAQARSAASNQSVNQALEEIFFDCSTEWPEQNANVWGGFLIVNANAQQQRETQKLLAGLRRQYLQTPEDGRH